MQATDKSSKLLLSPKLGSTKPFQDKTLWIVNSHANLKSVGIVHCAGMKINNSWK